LVELLIGPVTKATATLITLDRSQPARPGANAEYRQVLPTPESTGRTLVSANFFEGN
jgi:hypothetical protein